MKNLSSDIPRALKSQLIDKTDFILPIINIGWRKEINPSHTQETLVFNGGGYTRKKKFIF